MKKFISSLVFVILTLNIFSQSNDVDDSSHNVCLTAGVLQGGGSLLGVDLEILLSDKIGAQIGVGFVGYGAALNYHLQPSIKSSFLSLTYWHQGIGDNFAQSLLGFSYVYRGKKWFTAQIGAGLPLSKGSTFEQLGIEQPSVILIYSIGAYHAF